MSEEFDAETIRLIKEVHASKDEVIKRVLTKDEAIEFINKPIYFGYPKLISIIGRGRKSKRTQYDLAYNFRKNLYHRLVRLPKLSESGSKARSRDGEYLRNLILNAAEILKPVTQPHKLTSAVRIKIQIDLKHKRIFDERVVRRILRKLGY